MEEPNNKSDRRSHPIGVFDSGMGGISVLREITAYMPREHYIYVGDSANAPYGTKPVEKVRELTLERIGGLVDRHRAKAIAVACNTATSAAVASLRKIYPDLPLVGVEPAVKPAVLAGPHARVLVMATPRTLLEEKFLNLEHIYEDRARIFPLPCPGLMEYVEQGILDGKEIRSFLHELLDPYKEEGLTGIVLGCTNYPFLKKVISEVTDHKIPLFDGGEGTARELLRRVKEAGLLRTNPTECRNHSSEVPSDSGLRGSITFYNTCGDPDYLKRSIELYRYENPLADQLDLIMGDLENL